MLNVIILGILLCTSTGAWAREPNMKTPDAMKTSYNALSDHKATLKKEMHAVISDSNRAIRQIKASAHDPSNNTPGGLSDDKNRAIGELTAAIANVQSTMRLVDSARQENWAEIQNSAQQSIDDARAALRQALGTLN